MLVSGTSPCEEVGEDMAHEGQSGKGLRIPAGTLRPGRKEKERASGGKGEGGRGDGALGATPPAPRASLAPASQRGKHTVNFIHLQALGCVSPVSVYSSKWGFKRDRTTNSARVVTLSVAPCQALCSHLFVQQTLANHLLHTGWFICYFI